MQTTCTMWQQNVLKTAGTLQCFLFTCVRVAVRIQSHFQCCCLGFEVEAGENVAHIFQQVGFNLQIVFVSRTMWNS